MTKTGKKISKKKPGKKISKKMMFQMGYASSLGIAMIVAIFGCLMIGVYLDKKLGTDNIFTPLFLLIGVVAGFRNFYVFVKSTFPDKEKGLDKAVDNGRH